MRQFTIDVGNVTVDLAGHYIYHPGTPMGNIAISIQKGVNVTIQNGIIVGFTRGVFFNYPGGSTSNSGNIVQNLRLTNNGVRVTLFNAKGSIVRNNQITGPGSNVASTGIDIEGGGGNLVSANVVSAFGVCVFGEGGNYFTENMVSHAVIGFDLSNTDKYRFNTTFSCTAPFGGGTAVNPENN